MNSLIGIFVNRWMKFHLFLIPFMARSRGTFVKSKTISKDKTYDSGIDTFESVLYNAKLLLMELLAFGKAFWDDWRNLATGYREVFTEETMILNGIFCLWIFGRPYAFGKKQTLECKKKYSFFVMYSFLYQFFKKFRSAFSLRFLRDFSWWCKCFHHSIVPLCFLCKKFCLRQQWHYLYLLILMFWLIQIFFMVRSNDSRTVTYPKKVVLISRFYCKRNIFILLTSIEFWYYRYYVSSVSFVQEMIDVLRCYILSLII